MAVALSSHSPKYKEYSEEEEVIEELLKEEVEHTTKLLESRIAISSNDEDTQSISELKKSLPSTDTVTELEESHGSEKAQHILDKQKELRELRK